MIYKLLPMRGWPPRMSFHRLQVNKARYVEYLEGAYRRMIEERWERFEARDGTEDGQLMSTLRKS